MKDGGSAFPQSVSPGMTLRDWFAGQIVSQCLAELYSVAVREGARIDGGVAKPAADFAYEVADAMLAAREKKL